MNWSKRARNSHSSDVKRGSAGTGPAALWHSYRGRRDWFSLLLRSRAGWLAGLAEENAHARPCNDPRPTFVQHTHSYSQKKPSYKSLSEHAWRPIIPVLRITACNKPSARRQMVGQHTHKTCTRLYSLMLCTVMCFVVFVWLSLVHCS